MRKTASAVIAFILLATPALALQHPSGVGNKDAHICNVPYDPNDVVQVVGQVGDNVQILVGKDEIVTQVLLSDSANLRTVGNDTGSNTFSLRAINPMPSPKPIAVRTIKNGVPRDYSIQWIANSPPPVRVAAAAGNVGVEEVTPPPGSGTPCYVIRYTYAADVAAENAAKWQAGAAQRRQTAAEVALHQASDPMQCDTNNPFNPPECNYAYVVVGATQLSPIGAATGRPAIWDYRGTTVMRFPGNMAIPIVLVDSRDGKESQPSGLTVEDGGIVKIHSTERVIKLRDGDLVLCIYNQRYNQVGSNTGTGTVNDGVSRIVKTRPGK